MTYWWQIGDISMKLLKNLSTFVKKTVIRTCLPTSLRCQQNLNLSDNNSQLSPNCWYEFKTFHSLSLITWCWWQFQILMTKFRFGDILMRLIIREKGWWKNRWPCHQKLWNCRQHFDKEAIIIFGNKFEMHHYEMVNGEAQR